MSEARAIELARTAWQAHWSALPGADRSATPRARLTTGAELAREAREHGWEHLHGTEADVTRTTRVWSVMFAARMTGTAVVAVDATQERVVAVYRIPEG
ncbi:hypothetical protein [Sandaracinus amylolyticus]|uniref:Uncharacterized protein n=1 Tax=Sandaracinus amylolyticus TaxID=927083 RepID=A0A0F6YMK6_9BACT|nr:hypothetical protein [Sandaracinus amylolyticus]AKF10826.1 hypothetical protein DB32_007975 [Sandaracinus amylolyticus]